ncbi:hypothetical protein GTO10_01125 [Candidatus Saccharibacteria bacterium]|nr:hypothetical protein [Candidatus Saccharibacteria bacterium]
MSYWIDGTVLGEGPGLGRVVYHHVHDDGNAYSCTIATLSPTGVWGGEVGRFNPYIRVVCNFCNAVLTEDDEIRVEIKKGVDPKAKP